MIEDLLIHLPSLWILYQMDRCDKSKRYRKGSIWRARLPNEGQTNAAVLATLLKPWTLLRRQRWPWNASLWQVLRWPLSTLLCPLLSGPGSIHVRGSPRCGQGPSSSAPSPIRCTAAGRWQRERREHLEWAEAATEERWKRRGSRQEAILVK